MGLLSPYSGPWDRNRAAHLIYRAGFGGSADTIQEMVSAGLQSCVDRLVDFERVPEDAQKPEWAKPIEGGVRALRGASEEERKKFQKARRDEALDLKMWWVKRMVMTTRPLQEKLTLFWHGHFATSIQKVKLPYFMWLQNETFRRNAVGDWETMLKEISRDPAMVIWLDSASNRAGRPNENFARELMELFTLGEGHYSEKDIKESARAFTGYSVDQQTQEFLFRKNLHDSGRKRFFNRSGDYDGDDIIEIILSRPEAPRFIAKKMWEFFVYEAPSDELVDQLAALLKGNGYKFKPLLKTIFLSEEFYSSRAMKKQIKSPVQWLVGSVIALEAQLMPTRMINGVLRLLGQDLFAPPSVKGWDGGTAWITTSSLLARYNLANVLVNGVIPDEFLPGARRPEGKKQKKGEETMEMESQGPSMEDLMAEEKRQRARARLKEVASQKIRRLFDVKRIVDLGSIGDAETLVRELCKVLYLDGISTEDGRSIVEYVGKDFTEEKVRGALHLLMSTPHYQLC